MNVLPSAHSLARCLLYRGAKQHAAQLRMVASASAVEYESSEAEAFGELYSRNKRRKADKIVIDVDVHDGATKQLLMNKDVSTPYHCALHINKGLADSSALCVVKNDGSEKIVSMHEPLDASATLQFVSFQSEEFAEEVNKAYWRSCSILLGSLLSSSFARPITPIGAVDKQYTDGCFAYEIEAKNLGDWQPNSKNFSSLVLSLYEKFVKRNVPFNVLQVDASEAEQFSLGSRHTQSDSRTLLCRVGEHVESIEGPVIGHAGQIGRFAIVKASSKPSGVWRFSAVSLPFSQSISSYNWGIITDYSQKIAS